MRPLLDYVAVAAAYCNDSKDKLSSLYRTSARKILGFKRNASNHIINTIIQYNYHLLPAISINVYSQKWEAYLSNDSFNEEIYLKVAFPYEKLETRALPLKLIQTYNLLTTNNKCTECSSKDRTKRLSIEHLKQVHGEDFESKLTQNFVFAKELYQEIIKLKGKFDRSEYKQRKKYKEEKEELIQQSSKFCDIWSDMYTKVLKFV